MEMVGSMTLTMGRGVQVPRPGLRAQRLPPSGVALTSIRRRGSSLHVFLLTMSSMRRNLWAR